MTDLHPQYNPKDVEEARYQQWESEGLFQAEVDPSRTPYTIVIPPPNVTGILHMGHALNNTIQDILIRFKRMQGFNALWLPGTDHAGIATQNVVEKALAKEGKRRQDLGRDAFIKRVWDWKDQYGNTILYQLKRLGSSCDWRRTRFTMDEGLSEAVAEVFVRLYKRGLIYRGNYIINWCPRCQTALADEEAPREETQGKLYHIRYPLDMGQGSRMKGEGTPRPSTLHPSPGFIEVATTRPETMLGDTAVAVHPKDKRYKALIGRHAILPLVGRTLPIIADEAVDRGFGTGAVKVTPAHDPVDFQLGKKHGLEFLNVMADDARMTNVPKPYEGLDRFDCRSKLIVDLEREGYLGKIDEHVHNVGHCYRCHTAIEPRLSLQWFVKMQPLAQPAIKAVKDGTITFVPSRWTKVYLNWMEHIQDWCISRQIWWGHRLPVYYCQACAIQALVKGQGSRVKGRPLHPTPFTLDQAGAIVSKTRPEKCPACGGTGLTQDEDVLDTWFSSWLWPFSTLGWPEKTKDLNSFYPTSTLVTAQEIIFFWVARMIMAGYFCMKQPPFTTVYIHGTVRDLTGKKMSKSLGNIIDPLEIIDQYGTDALRYTLVTATAIGQDVFLSEERFAAGRNFANKLWNAARFVPASDKLFGENPRISAGTVADRWIYSRLHRTIQRVTLSLDKFLFNEAATAIYDFIWHDFCDWYLEIAKMYLAQRDTQTSTHATLKDVLETSLKLLHPIMPFVTEELWQHLGDKDKSLMKEKWPEVMRTKIDLSVEAEFELFKGVVSAIRNTRVELNVPLGSRPPVRLSSAKPTIRTFFEAHRALLQTLAQTGEVSVEATRQRVQHAAAAVVDGVEVLIPLAGLIDPKKEEARLQQKIEELSGYISQTGARLRDPRFAAKAPKDVVQDTRARLAQAEETHKKLSDLLALVQSM